MTKKAMKKNFIWNIVGSTINAFNSLFFMIIVTRINGINDAGLFTFAYSTACFLYIIGVYSGRVYQINDDSDITDSDYFYSKIFTCLVMVIVGIVFCIVRGYNLIKTIILVGLVIYRGIDAFSEAFYAIVQEHNELYKVGISCFLKAIIGVPLFLIIDLLTHNIITSILVINVVSLMIMMFYDYRNVKLLKFRIEKINLKNVYRTLILGFSAFAFCFLTQYVMNAPRYTIDSILEPKFQTIFGIIVMPATVIALLGQFVLQPFVTVLKNDLKINKPKFLKLNIKLIIAIFVLGVIATTGLVICGPYIFKLLYGLNLQKYTFDLLLIMIGSICYAITLVLSTSLISMKSTFSQFMIYLITSIFAFTASNTLIRKYAIVGASYSYCSSMILLLIMYIIVFIFVYKRLIRNEQLKK